MSEQPPSISVAEMYGDWGITDDELDALLARSLGPRSPDMLFDRLAALGAGAGHTVLDVGCRDARHAWVIARRLGCRVVGIDPVEYNLRLAAETIAREGAGLDVTVLPGTIEAIPLPDASVDYIWCRDVLSHVADLRGGFAECRRVLRPGGAMLTFTTFGTDALEPGERARLCPPLAVVERNLSMAFVEGEAAAAGLALAEREVLGGEWREWREEQGDKYTSRQLLQCSRMLRDRERLIGVIGRVAYESSLANCLWGVYQMIGKLAPAIHVFRPSKRQSPDADAER